MTEKKFLELYFNTITEKDFFLWFKYFLLNNDFFDVSFNNGPFEYGKDYIAKRKEKNVIYQYSFQIKTEAINNDNDIQKIQGQLFEAMSENSPNPIGYDEKLPKRLILVSLRESTKIVNWKGKTWLLGFKKNAEKLWFQFDYRDQSVLINGSSTSILNWRYIKEWEKLLNYYSKIKVSNIELSTIKDILKDINTVNNVEDTMGIIVVAHFMVEKNLFLYAFLLLIWQYYINTSSNDSNKDIAIFSFSLWQYFKDKLALEKASLWSLDKVAIWFVDYIIVCTVLLECASALSVILEDDKYLDILKEDIVDLLRNKGVTRIMSDNYAVSIDITIFAMRCLNFEKKVILDYIKWVTIWLLDRCDKWKYAFWIPPLDSTPETEVKNLLWYAFNFYEPIKTPSLMAVGSILYWIKNIDPIIYKDYVDNFLCVQLYSATLYTDENTCVYYDIDKDIPFSTKNKDVYLKQLIDRTVYL